MKEPNPEEIIGSFERAVHFNPDSLSARLMLGESLLDNGYFERSILNLERALALDPENKAARSLLENARSACMERNKKLRRKKEFGNYKLLKCLGVGWEGAVYLARSSTGSKYILKLFHPEMKEEINRQGQLQRLRDPVSRCLPDLVKLSDQLKQDRTQNTLYPFDLFRVDGKIAGVLYEFEPLVIINKRYLSYNQVADCIAGAFFRTTAYLCGELRLCLADASLTQWMITRNGQIRYIDYGIDIIPVDDFRCKEDHWHVVALVILLFQMFNPKKRRLFRYTNFEIVFDDSNGIVFAVEKHPWLKEVISAIKAKNYRLFLDPDFNLKLSKGLPERIRPVALSGILLRDALSKLKRRFSSMPA